MSPSNLQCPCPVHYRLHTGSRSSHQQIARCIRQINAGPILDVGTAQGIIGQLMHDSGLEVDGVEPSPAWADAARPYYRRVFASTIEQAPLPGSHYRIVVCGDVLEHTVDPVAVLRQLQSHATDDAVFIISVPNVAHLAVRLMLLMGRFPQMDRGILDRTHLHFFTRDTAQQMLRDAGLTIEKVSCTPVPLDGVFSGLMMSLQHGLLYLAPRLFAMQWIFIARRSPCNSPAGPNS